MPPFSTNHLINVFLVFLEERVLVLWGIFCFLTLPGHFGKFTKVFLRYILLRVRANVVKEVEVENKHNL